MFTVTKQFTKGFMAGLTITEKTTVEFIVGKTYTPCAGSSAYIVIACERI